MIEVAHICLSPKSYVNIYRHSDYVVPYLKCFLFMSEAEVRPYPSEIAEKTCFAIICRHKTDITALMHRVLSLLSISRNLLTPPRQQPSPRVGSVTRNGRFTDRSRSRSRPRGSPSRRRHVGSGPGRRPDRATDRDGGGGGERVGKGGWVSM